MKLTEFKALCEDVWKECYGEIVTLWLTEDSYKKLHDESVVAGMSGETELFVRSDYQDLGPAHPIFNSVTNPITKSAVRLRIARDQDVADIYSQKDKVMFSRVITKASD